VWVDGGWLTERGVRQWTEVPIWRTAPGTWAIDAAQARAAGLDCRPLTETIADTWAWLASGGRPANTERQEMHGLDPQRERELLAAWLNRPPEAPTDATR